MEQFKAELKEDGKVGLASKENIYLLLWSLSLGLLFNLLFFEKALGLSYPLFLIALYCVLFWNAKKYRQWKVDRTWLLGIPLGALSFSYIFFSNPIFAALNFLMIPVLFIAHTLLLTTNNRYKWFEPQFLVDLLYAIAARPLGNCFKPFSLLTRIAGNRTDSGKFSVAGKVLAGLLLTIPLLFLIVPLLASADDVFRHFIELIPNVFRDVDLTRFVVRSIIVTVITCLVFSYLWSLFRSQTVSGGIISAINLLPKPGRFLDPITVITILSLIDILYLFFMAIQFSYLFGGMTNGLPQNFTYAQYARKGFFELVAVTLINLVILLGNLNLTKGTEGRVDKAVKVLNTVLVVSTFLMLFSAHYRMYMYEEAYGFTYLRVLTHAFMGYLFVLFFLTLTKIWRQTIPLLKCFIAVSIVAYTLVNYINIDRFIVQKNIERYNKGNPIDIMYLTTLSYDAVPQLVDLIHTTGDRNLAAQLENGLKSKKQALEKASPWQSFNISKLRAKKALSVQNAP